MENSVCQKCGGTNVKVYVKHRGRKVGKCLDKACGYWGDLGKAEKAEIEAAKQARREKKTRVRSKGKAAPAASRNPATERGATARKPEPAPVPGPAAKRSPLWWLRDIFSEFD